MTIIGLKELRENTQSIIDRTTKGEHFTVVRRSKPVFELHPPQAGDVADLDSWLSDYVAANDSMLKSLADK